MTSPTAIAHALSETCIPTDERGRLHLGPGLTLVNASAILTRLRRDLADTGTAGYGPRSMLRTSALNRLRLLLAARRRHAA